MENEGAVELPNKICYKIRQLFKNCPSIGYQWPFLYNHETSKMRLIKTAPPFASVTQSIYCSKGRCVMNLSNSSIYPEIISKIGEDTSQGKVFIAIVDTDSLTFRVVLKVDVIKPQCARLWITRSEEKYLKGANEELMVLLNNGYVDAVASVLLSNLVEQEVSPHFPLCYGTFLAGARFKRNTERMSGVGNMAQMIWMEYLPFSMCTLLDGEKDINKWWSALFQIVAGMQAARNAYSFIHNDLHCNNIRVRKVAEDSVLYYKNSKGQYFKVPTYGYVYVIIDFGRSYISPWKNENKHALVSHDFTEQGDCPFMVANNPSADFTRLIGSIEELSRRSLSTRDYNALLKFYHVCCQTSSKLDLIDIWKQRRIQIEKLTYYLDEYPKKNANANLTKVFDYVGKHFIVKMVPLDVQTFPL